MPESETEELARRANILLDGGGVWMDTDQKELILSNWSKWAIILVRWRDSKERKYYTSVYYDVPATKIVFSDNPDDAKHPAGIDGLEFVPVVLDAFRRMMLLDDLADA